MGKRTLTKAHKEKLSVAARNRWQRERNKAFSYSVAEQLEVFQYDANIDSQELKTILNKLHRQGCRILHIIESKRFIIHTAPKQEVIEK